MGGSALNTVYLLLVIATVYLPSDGQNTCVELPCKNGGTCNNLNGTGNFDCMCPLGWEGSTCEEPDLTPCTPDLCQNGGTCLPNVTGANYNCTCTMGYSGMRCENMMRQNCMPPCGNGGTCQMNACLCPMMFSGNTCQQANSGCPTMNPCKNGGTCMPNTGAGSNPYVCNCRSGWQGQTCTQVDMSPCTPNPCQNGGMCLTNIGQGSNYNCTCVASYSGMRCENMPQNCMPPCQNGGTCQGNGNCMCSMMFSGSTCQQANNNTMGLSTGTIIGLIIASVVAVLLATIVVMMCLRKKNMHKRSSNTQSSLPRKSRGDVVNYDHELSAKPNPKPRRSTFHPLPDQSVIREFPRHQLHLLGMIGSGSFGVVYKAKAVDIICEGTNTTVAVKMLKESASYTDQSDFKKELDLYLTMKPHPNVVSMLGCCTDKEPVYIILEYVPHGNLQTYLRHIRTGDDSSNLPYNKTNLTPTEIITYAYQVANGMEYLSSKQFIHRDLATRNILLGEGFVCKVADFGLARDMAGSKQYEMKSQGRLPVRWMAPEALINNIYTIKTDVWSFGVLLWELVTLGSHPYPGMTSMSVIEQLKKGYRLPKPDHCSEDIYNVMRDCWQEKPKDRPDFSQLHQSLDSLLTNATGYLEMSDLKTDDYVYLEPGQDSSSAKSA